MNQQTDIASQMMAYYREIASRRGGGGWRSVGEKIGYSGAYARQIAMGAKPVTPDIAGDWLASVDWEPKQDKPAVHKRQRAKARRLWIPPDLTQACDIAGVTPDDIRSLIRREISERTHEA